MQKHAEGPTGGRWIDSVGEACAVAAQNRRALLRRGWVDSAKKCGPGCSVLDERR